jgi:hypothetical protein
MSRWWGYRRKMSDSRELQWQSSQFWGAKVKESKRNWERKKIKWTISGSAIEELNDRKMFYLQAYETRIIKNVIKLMELIVLKLLSLWKYKNMPICTPFLATSKAISFILKFAVLLNQTIWLIPIISFKCLNLVN